MAQSDRHFEIATKIRDLIRASVPVEFSTDDVRIEDFPFKEEPTWGIAISPMQEEEGLGTNERDDIMYVTQISRNLSRPGYDPDQEHLISKSSWRNTLRLLFHRKRIGLAGCELLSRCEFGRISQKQEWNNANVDSSVLMVISSVREQRIAS